MTEVWERSMPLGGAVGELLGRCDMELHTMLIFTQLSPCVTLGTAGHPNTLVP